ncbi:conserved hypothetical protein [Streptomyces scabiei 87.22]|uniref:Uncharacterized protein n=3 Tax=Streptomyces TaxID=1883 RepID=A0ABW9IDF9_STRGJ|nr:MULTISPECIES: hypothetical protein [Streptomyces]CBG70344.1 conserved hypothetical protein [Streptomyces scabiei 87.22]MDX2682837.1 hypothetical protein [Streptomyces sp. NY05-11A]MDX3168761.1 hypothetical protein [Streptomyces scabiei]MDX3277569.1 hypothetical protein [Streptomyces scabiei]MDX3479044.1 hypothetical protein [Streptomyces scabiei]
MNHATITPTHRWSYTPPGSQPRRDPLAELHDDGPVVVSADVSTL